MQYNEKHGYGIKISTGKQLLQRFPIALAKRRKYCTKTIEKKTGKFFIPCIGQTRSLKGQ